MNPINTIQHIPAQIKQLWPLDPSVTFLNHGSFGACPSPVLERQRMYRDQLEAEPVQFFIHNVQHLIDESRQTLADFVGTQSDDLVFVSNATTGVNAVMRSLDWNSEDELLVTDHAYNACRNVLDWIAKRTGAKVVVAQLPFPVENNDEIVDAIIQKISPRTRIAMIDHVTSISAVVMPIARIVSLLQSKGVDVLVDGAHAPGMIPLQIDKIGAAYYTGNCHKWLCAPKGAGFLHVRPDRQDRIMPTVISHGYNKPRMGRKRFHDLFDWAGTIDPTPWLCVGDAIHFMQTLLPGGWETIMQHNHELAFQAQQLLVNELGIKAPVPRAMLGSIATIPIPDAPTDLAQVDTSTVPTPTAKIQVDLMNQYQIQVPINYWPTGAARAIRISAQLYNDRTQYTHLCECLCEQLEKELEK